MIRSKKSDGVTLTEEDHCRDLIAKRKANGKSNLPKSVKRWSRRTGQQIPEVKDVKIN